MDALAADGQNCGLTDAFRRDTSLIVATGLEARPYEGAGSVVVVVVCERAFAERPYERGELRVAVAEVPAREDVDAPPSRAVLARPRFAFVAGAGVASTGSVSM